MDDFLPLMIFNIENVINAVKMKNSKLVVALLPMTLLSTAVLDHNLSRSDRMKFLSFAWAILFVYRNYKNKSKLQTSQKKKGKNKFMRIYDTNTLDKALSLIYGLSCVIADPRAVHMGSLGTH